MLNSTLATKLSQFFFHYYASCVISCLSLSRVGRVKIMMFTSLCQFLLGVSVAFSGNYYLFVVLRFLLAMVSCMCVCERYI